jgi:hypothetical protein
MQQLKAAELISIGEQSLHRRGSVTGKALQHLHFGRARLVLLSMQSVRNK